MTALTCNHCGIALAGRTHSSLNGIVAYSLCWACSRHGDAGIA